MFEQGGEVVGLHFRFALAFEADVRFTTVGTIPYHDPVAGRGDRFRQGTDAGILFGKPASRCDDPGVTLLSDDFVAEGQAVDGSCCHARRLASPCRPGAPGIDIE